MKKLRIIKEHAVKTLLDVTELGEIVKGEGTFRTNYPEAVIRALLDMDIDCSLYTQTRIKINDPRYKFLATTNGVYVMRLCMCTELAVIEGDKIVKKYDVKPADNQTVEDVEEE